MPELKTHEWERRTGEILSQARDAFRESKHPEVQDLESQLPDGTANSEGPLTIAFAGQYSAGKSTIIKALTGNREIETGAGITTRTTQAFDWNGVKLIDTPGIHTELRPDHDATTYNAISQSDLLVFVITNELFDSHLGAHCRKLAIDLEKGHEMILVVNKMDRAAAGNTPCSRAVITEDLRAPLCPFTPEELRTTFIDAQSALKALEENDREIADARERQANTGELFRNLNGLIRDKGLTTRHTTALYTIDQIMQEAMAAEPTGDEDIDLLVEIYHQNIRVVRETARHLRQAVRNDIDKATGKVRRLGDDCAQQLSPGITQEDWEEEITSLDSKSEEVWLGMVEQIQQTCTEVMPEMQKRLDELHNSQRFQSTLNNIRDRSSSRNATNILRITQKAAEQLGRVGTKAAMPTGARGLSAFSGTPAHNLILGIGHRLGHSFQPWQAVKIASGVRTASAFLSGIAVITDVLGQIQSEREEDKRDREFAGKRREIRAYTANMARHMEAEAVKAGEEVIQEFLTEPMEEMQRQVDELNQERETKNEHLKHLSNVSEQARALIAEIHREGLPA